MFTKTKRALIAALMLGAASGALASDGSGTALPPSRNPMAMHAAPKAKRQITPRAYGANAYRPVPAPSRQPEAEWPRMNCDMPIGC